MMTIKQRRRAVKTTRFISWLSLFFGLMFVFVASMNYTKGAMELVHMRHYYNIQMDGYPFTYNDPILTGERYNWKMGKDRRWL